MPKILQHT